ncbi:MAG: protein kinase domain-containing protein [Acidobacteriota bacterium]
MQPDDPDDPPTLRATPNTLADSSARPPEIVDDETRALDGYVFGDVIGRGGIGEIVQAHDLRIGRDVAIKRLRTGSPSDAEVARFMREARIQARLDHPAIPPVHELGRDAQGRPYFAMKKLVGVTLHELLSVPQQAQQGRPRLLRAFADVCLAIEFAHARGVVHRDLKPANIMLGDFGDVYVLDWGLARVVGEAVAEVVTQDIDSLEIKTGDVLGTPGYMSPEQLKEAAEAGRPADIYALGSILFEMLAGEPLHPRGANALPSTLGGEAITSPGKRRPDRAVPPELDALCAAMLQMEPAARPNARRVAERVQSYLDGDRDVVRRKAMATDLVWTARAALEDHDRVDAMRTAGRALALDPESGEAAELVTALMLQPPAEPPAELREALRETDNIAMSRHARTAIVAYLAIGSMLPVAAWNGVRKWDVVMLVFAGTLAMATSAWRIMQRPQRTFSWMFGYAIGNALLMALLTRMIGPFTFVPALSCVVVMSCMAYPQFAGARQWVLIATLVIGWSIPVALEHLGTIARTWSIENGTLISHAGALDVNTRSTVVVLVVASIATIVIAGVHAARIYGANREAQHQLATQAWHLRQLLPAARTPSVS